MAENKNTQGKSNTQAKAKPKAKVFEVNVRLTVPPGAKRPTVTDVKDLVQDYCDYDEPQCKGVKVGKVGLKEIATTK